MMASIKIIIIKTRDIPRAFFYVEWERTQIIPQSMIIKGRNRGSAEKQRTQGKKTWEPCELDQQTLSASSEAEQRAGN